MLSTRSRRATLAMSDDTIETFGFLYLFLFCSNPRDTVPIMQPEPTLTPATDDDLVQSLAFALQYEGRKRVHDAASLAAQIAARRLVRHLERSGFVVVKRPASPALTTPAAMEWKED